MQAPLWKRLLSHFIEVHIEGTSSQHNPQLDVCLVRGRYQLCTENAIYSFEDLYNNFGDAFKKIHLDQLPGQDVLVLGFGMASIPTLLEKKMGKNYHYTGIEIDEEVIYLTSKYVLDELQSNIELICADAASWMAQNIRKFDLIAVDLFLDDVIPHVFEQATFLRQVKDALNPGGILLYNRLAYTPNDVEKARHFFEHQFSAVFEGASYLDLDGNWMLVNDQTCLR
ncbi:MAG: class I SAM-dependent methyltransferase [Bacteroidota bacterium]